MPLKLATATYAIRNRLLRYGKRYRQYISVQANGQLITQQQTSFRRPTLFIGLLCISLLIFIYYLCSTLFYDTSNSVYKSTNTELVSSNAANNNQNKLNSFYEKILPTEFNIQLNKQQWNKFTIGLVFNESDRIKKEIGYREHAFNTLVSERIGLHRSIPDTRHELCRKQSYPFSVADKQNSGNLLNERDESMNQWDTSVIICFFNEDLITLQRTVYSVLDRTPAHLLREILLVDDHSDNDTPTGLEQYRNLLETSVNNHQLNESELNYLQKVHYFRTPERSGLIRARLYGSQFTNGKVLFFLDSHCEVNQQWLEPLVQRIAERPHTVVCPIIDLIDADTFDYTSSPLVRGGFNWGLHFKWDSISTDELRETEDFIKPVRSPTMAGGLFAIEKDYFYQLGSYDSGMNIWGGENVEISFRIWMCGGQLEIIPCSRVGHVFRSRRPYGSPAESDTLAYNSLRVAHVWMDEYKKYFLASRSDLNDMPYGDVQDRIKLRKSLNCSTFEWYLQNVYPELLTPEEEQQKKREEESAKKIDLFARKQARVMDKFVIQLVNTTLCLESQSETTYKVSTLSLEKCSRRMRRQHWQSTSIDDIRLGPKNCLDTTQGKYNVKLTKCHEMGGTQQWSFDESKRNTQLYNSGSGMCLTAAKNVGPFAKKVTKTKKLFKSPNSEWRVYMSYCSDSSDTNAINHWDLLSY